MIEKLASPGFYPILEGKQMDNQAFEGKLSIIMPAYNEGENIKASINETAIEMERAECPYEIFVKDDGSTHCRNSEIQCEFIENFQNKSDVCEQFWLEIIRSGISGEIFKEAIEL